MVYPSFDCETCGKYAEIMGENGDSYWVQMGTKHGKLGNPLTIWGFMAGKFIKL